MKVIFSQSLPFFLAHGGAQTFTELLMRELTSIGVQVEPERWWDETQSGDILHFVGRPPSIANVRMAKQKGFRLVMTEFLDQPASRQPLALTAQRFAVKSMKRLFPGFISRLAWDAYRELDAMVYAVPHEWETAKYLFDADSERGFIIPHGVDTMAIDRLRQADKEGDYLISVATIAPRKNTHLLATAARLARVPVLFVGKPYSKDEPYFARFETMVDNRYVRYAGFVSDDQKYEYLRQARGFALLSQFESGCIAIYEAAAAGLPLFLSNLPWAAKAYTDAKSSRFVQLGNVDKLGRALADFYKNAHRRSETTFPILSWTDVATRYRAIYEGILTR